MRSRIVAPRRRPGNLAAGRQLRSTQNEGLPRNRCALLGDDLPLAGAVRKHVDPSVPTAEVSILVFTIAVRLTTLQPGWLLEAKHNHAAASRDADVLSPFELVRDRIRPDFAPGLEAPQELAARRIEREEVTFHRARKNQIARSGKQPAPRRRLQIELPS